MPSTACLLRFLPSNPNGLVTTPTVSAPQSRAISSPLLEGASVNGSRGVIINVTGGPDLSLVEVSEASSIVQEAAHEDANIIFGAVVDPNLKGKVKITVIATGFGGATDARAVGAPAHTPVDMTAYVDHPRLRGDAGPPPMASADRAPSPRLSIARRPALELPLTAAGSAAASQPHSTGDGDARTSRAANPDADSELSPAFDVPAFLRRQEG